GWTLLSLAAFAITCAPGKAKSQGVSFMLKALPTVSVLLLLAFLSGCPQEWHFSIAGFDSEANLQFCVTKRPDCRGSGVSLSYFIVEEVPMPRSDSPRHTVWAIEHVSNEPLREFTYGIPPLGWKQEKAPEPLRLGIIYSVGPYWFRLTEKGGKLGYEVARSGELK
ncbi:MAG: hypothetical protein ACRERD_20675, partial [Candidatus Binatia bacterium]